MAEPLVSLTPAAAAQLRSLMAGPGQGSLGLRLGVKTTGCSGYSYVMDFARELAPGDATLDAEGVRLLVDAKAAGLLAGTEMDWVEDRLGAQFVFRNPNEKARCGCGESFSV